MGLETNLGYSDNATYGLDTLALGLSNANGSPQIQTQVVAAFATDDYYVGLFGLGHQGVNFSEYSTPNATFLTTLKDQDMIPSLSWGYTAGAIYREYGSLLFEPLATTRVFPGLHPPPLPAHINSQLSCFDQRFTDLKI